MKKEKYRIGKDIEKNTIGILGATGSVGKKAAETLIEYTDYRLLLGSRDKSKLQEIYDADNSIKEYMQVDINDKVGLEEFCSSCYIILNCAGPSEVILDKVALACIEQGVHYIDVSGGEKLYELLKNKDDIIKSKKLLFIVACGVYPGLSEIYSMYIMKKYFDYVDRLKVYFTTQGRLSFSSAYDYICGIENKTGKGMKYIKKGCLTNIKNNKIQKYDLGQPVGIRYCYPIVNIEFERLCQNNNIDEAYFYNTFFDKEDMENAMLIKRDSKRLGKEVLAKKMMGRFVGDEVLNDFTMIYITCEGTKNNKEIEFRGRLLYQGAGNDISGIVGANVIEMIMCSMPENYGTYYVTDILDAENLIIKLGEKYVLSYENVDELQEGEII